MTIFGRTITQEDMNDIARYMDDDIRERLHIELAPCAPEEFIEAYLREAPDFEELLEDTFKWARNTETAEQFVGRLYDGSANLYDEATAADELAHLRAEWGNIPSSVTPEAFATVWNDFVLQSCEVVTLPDGKRVPRFTQMTDRQIAKAIQAAYDWDEVKDLVQYIDSEYLDLPVDWHGDYEGDWESAVEDWCDKQ